MFGGEAETLRPEWDGLRLELEEIQQSEVLVPIAVDGRSVAEVVSGWTGVPVGAMLGDTISTARTLKQLSRLQQLLGEINDVHVAVSMLPSSDCTQLHSV